MTTTLNSATAAREAYEQQVQYICGRLTLAGADAAVKIGKLPIGCVILGVSTRVVTAFSGGTPVLGAGTTAALTGTSGNIASTMAITAGSSLTQPSATVAQPLAGDTDIYFGSSGGATAGDAVVAVQYVKPLN
jgi:hypothetical protein